MKRCHHCGKKFDGRATQKYCGASCKTAAYRSRHRQHNETKAIPITPGQLKDLNLIRERSEDAHERLMRIRSMLGRLAFEEALDAVYSAVMDIVAGQD